MQFLTAGEYARAAGIAGARSSGLGLGQPDSPLLVEDTEPQRQRRDSFLTGKEYRRQRAQEQLQRPSSRLQPSTVQQQPASIAPPSRPSMESQVDERSILRQTGDAALDTVGGLGNILDVPGSVVRDVLTWLPGGPAPENPLDQLLPWNWADSDVRISGEELLEGYGLLDDSGEPKGLGTTLGRMGAGIGLEVLLDPLTYLSFGASAAVKGAGKGAQAARSLKKVGLLDNIDIYAKNAGKVSEAAGDIGKRESLLKMSATDAIQNPVKQSGTSASKASDSLGKEFENALAGDKHFKKAAEAKGAKRGSKEWNKMVDEVKDANISDGYMRFRLPGGIVDTSFGSGLAPGVDRLARGMRYSRPIIGVTSRMSKTFEGAKTPESQKAIREAKNLLQQDFVVSKQEMFDNIRQLHPLLNDFNKYNQAGEVVEEVSGEVLQQKRNQMGNFMIEYLEDVGRVRKQDDQLIAEELMDEDSGILEFMLSRDEIFEETSQDYAARFLKEKYDALKGSDNAEIAEQADDIIARLQASIEPLNRIKTQMDDLVVEASDMNVDVTQLQDLYSSYFPRIRQTSKGTITGNKSGGSKLFDPETPHKIQREDRYRNIVGGTAALNRMSTDTRFAGRLSPTLWNKTKELAEKKGQLQDEFFSVDKGYGAEMANLSDDAKKDLFKAITERTPEDVQKNIPLFSVNPADAALRALESAYKARSNADVLRKIVADSMVIRDRGIDETEAAIKNTFGVEGAESALGTVSEAAQTVGRGTNQGMSDVVRQLDIQDGRTPPDQTGAGVKRPDRPDGPGGDGNPATPEPDGPTGGTPDGSPSPVQEGDAKAVAEIIENIPARQTDPEYMSDEEIISRLDALSRLESSKNAGDRELAASARQQIQEERPQIFDESLRLDDAAETATIESRIREISESSLEELTAEGGVLAVNAPALRKLRNELFGEGHGLKGRSAEQIRQTIYQEAKKRAGKAKQDSVQENLSNIKFDNAEMAAPLEPGEMLSQFDASDSRSLNVLDATGFFMGKSDGASYMIRLADADQSSALASLGRNRTPASDNTMRAARESVQDFEDKIVRSVSGDAKYQGYAEVEGMQLSQYVDGLGNRFIVPGRVVDTIEDMYPDAIIKSYQERNQVAGLVFLDEDANVLARVEKLASKSAAAQKAETLRTAAKRPSTGKLDDALSQGTGPRERRATGELELTNEQMRAISHRLDDPDSIAESLQSQMLDGDDELIERLGYSQAADEAEFRERVGEVSQMLAAGRFDDAMKQDGELAAEILEQSVDDSINTYLDMSRQELGGDLTKKQFNTIKREFARAKQSVESYLKVPPRAIDQLDPAASARDRVYSQMIEAVGEEQAAANIALSDAFANQVVKSENNVGSVDEYYERYLTQVQRMDEYIKGREDTLNPAELMQGQQVSSLARSETEPLVLAHRGSILTNQLGEQAVITLFNGSDISTLPHELSHAFRRQLHLLDDDLLLRVENHYGVNNARFTTEQEEAFAEDFERYLSIGKAPTKELESVFSKMKQWLLDVYRGAIGTPLERELSDEMRDIFDTMLGKEPMKRGPDVPNRPKVSKKEHHRRRDILADYYGVHKNSITRARREEIEDALAEHIDDAIDNTEQSQMLRLLRDRFHIPRKKKNGVFVESEKQHLNRIDAKILKMVKSAQDHVERGAAKKGHIVESLNEQTGRGGDYSTWQFSDDSTASDYVAEHSPIISQLSPTENYAVEAIFEALLKLEINNEIVTLKKRRGAKGPLAKSRNTIALSKPDIYADEQILDLTDKLARERGHNIYEQVFGVDQLDEEGDIFDQVIAARGRQAANESLPPDEQFQRAIVRQDPKPEMFEAGKYFDQKAFDRADTGYKSRRTIVEMDIQDFLRMAERLDQARPSSQADVATAVAEGQKFSDLPYLSFSNDGKGAASVVSHEGRHRAMELAAQGETKMPVILESAGGQEIRWSEQGKRSGFDRVSGTWPKELVTQNRGSADSIPFPIEDPLEVSQPGIQPAAPLLNEDAVTGDQMGLFQGEGKRRKFRSDIKKGPKAKQSSLFETSNAKVDRDQMDLFGDDATPEDLVYKPKPDEGKDPDMLFQSAFSGVKREVRNAEGEVVAQVEMPSSKWATNSKRTVVRAMDGARPQDMVRVMSDLVVEELDRLDPSLSQQAQKTYGVVNNNWDLRITKGGVTKSAREWLAEDMVRFSEGKIKPPVGMHKYMAGFKQHLSKLMGKRGESLANDVRVGQLFNELLKPESSGMVPFFSETGESVMGAMGVNLDALRSTTKKLNHRGDRARKAMVALIPPEAAETARQNILRERHSARRRRWIENRDNWQNEADELKKKLADLAGSDDDAAISEFRKQLRGVERQIQDIPEASYDDWYRNALRSDKRKYKGVELDIEPQMWLGQVKLPRRIAEDLVSVSKATTYLTDDSSIGSLIGWFDGYNKLFKTNVTSTNPGFHVRNYFSGFIQNALNDVTDPRFGAMDIRRYTKPYGDSQSLMKGKTIEGAGDIPLFSDLKVAKGQNKDEVATEEIAELLFIHEIINAPGTHRDIPGEAPATLQSQMIGPSFGKHDKVIFGRNSFALNRSKTAPVAKQAKAGMSQSEKAVVRVRDTYKKYLDIAQNVGDAVEIQHRAGGFIALLRQGYSPEEAARIVKMVQVDYSNLSSFEKEYMRRFFPFYSFSRGMAVYLANELATNPAGKVGIAIRAQRHGRDRDVATPTYISKGLSLPMGSNADGTRHYLTNIGMMHEQPVQQLAPFAALSPGDAAFNVIGNMNPLLKLPLELAFDESSFQQSVSGGVDLDDADPPLGRALSNVAQGLGLRDKDRKQPYRLGKLTEAVAGSSPFSRYTNTVRTAFDPRKNIAQRAANTLTGLRISSVSPDRQDAVLRERAEMFLQTQGARQFQKSYIPDEIKANMTEEELKAVTQYELLIEILAKRSKERRNNKEKESK